MKRKNLILIIAFCGIWFGAHELFAQNILKNGSFEELKPNWNIYHNYPITGSYYTITPNLVYFNTWYTGKPNIGIGFQSGVPVNHLGYQHPRTGQGYVAIGEIWFNPVFPLGKPMNSGQCYKIRYFVSRCDLENCASDALDGYFSSDSITFLKLAKDKTTPQFTNPNGIIYDTLRWTQITGDYIADGTEKFFALGLFFGPGRTSCRTKICTDSTIQNFNGAEEYSISIIRLDLAAAYYLDDVAIWECGTPEYPADAGPDRQICSGEQVEIGAMEQKAEYMYLWSDRSWFGPRHQWDTIATTPKLTVNPEKTTTYYLWSVDFKWEHTYDSVTVFVEQCDIKLEIPNVFTPNGDGFNDYFMINNPTHVNYTLEVFNRWGSPVFVGSQNYFWDGSFNGEPAPTGAYFYVLKAATTDGTFTQDFHGSVTILR
jgi:gliding motility-associated-like protein